MTVREDIEDAAAQGKLSRLIHIVHLTEAEAAQRVKRLVYIDRLIDRERQCTRIQILARHHHLGQCLRVSDHEEVMLVDLRQHFRAQYLTG